MANNEFNQVVSIDFVPQASRCEWCGKPAIQQLTAIGGPYHNEGGFFCLHCGNAFSRIVAEADALMTAAIVATSQQETGSADTYSLDNSALLVH